jgi:hypothetical protein
MNSHCRTDGCQIIKNGVLGRIGFERSFYIPWEVERERRGGKLEPGISMNLLAQEMGFRSHGGG